MSETYFAKFPTITYNGQQAIDITKGLKIAPTVFSNPFIFQDHQLIEGERSDLAASKVYGDPYMEWLLFLSNRQIDPYSWYMTYDEFYDYVNQKYGDWVLATNKTMYYVNNWYVNPDYFIYPDSYDALAASQTKFYQPVYDTSNNVYRYVRRPVNWQVSTNHLVKCYFTTNVATLVLDELMSVTWDTNVVGNGQVAFSNSSTLYFQHVKNNYIPINDVINSSAFNIIGLESNNRITISNTNQISIEVIDNILRDDEVFYDSVSYFDYENMLNESKKDIVVLDPDYTERLLNDFRTVF